MDAFRYTNSQREAPDLEVLLPCLREALPDILCDQPVMLAYLHGSVAEGYARSWSDVDIALVMAPEHGKTPYECLMIELAIEGELEARCELPNADVRHIDQAPLMVQGRVVTKGILLYSRDNDFRIDYEVYTRKRYLDFKPVADRLREAYFQRIREEE